MERLTETNTLDDDHARPAAQPQHRRGRVPILYYSDRKWHLAFLMIQLLLDKQGGLEPGGGYCSTQREDLSIPLCVKEDPNGAESPGSSVSAIDLIRSLWRSSVANCKWKKRWLVRQGNEINAGNL